MTSSTSTAEPVVGTVDEPVSLDAAPNVKAMFRHCLQDEHCTPQEAVNQVLDHFNIRNTILAKEINGYLLTGAKAVEASFGRKVRKWALQERLPKTNSPSTDLVHRQERQRAISQTAFRLPGGETVLWSKLTVALLDAKIAWMRAHMQGLAEHLEIMVTVRDLMVKHGVQTLEQVPDWADHVRDHMLKGQDGEDGPAAIGASA